MPATPPSHRRHAARGADPPTNPSPSHDRTDSDHLSTIEHLRMVRSNGWTAERIRALGTLVDIPTAGRIFGKGRSAAYAAAHTGTFPVPITIIGQRRWVTVASILAVLGLPAEPTPNPVAPPTT